jgi:glycosyltransferase involved in cell wall biosynthesis
VSVRIKSYYYQNIAKRAFDPDRNRAYRKRAAQAAARRIAVAGHFDFLIAPSSFPITGLNVNLSKFVWLDATFSALVDYYPGFEKERLSQETLREGLAMESQALRECAGVFFSSDWAAESAIRDYQLEERRVHVIPFGANLTPPYRDAAAARVAIQKRTSPPFEFLFLGVDWQRKGGALAVEVVQKLNASGIPSRLTSSKPGEIRTVGFLDKTNPGHLARLNELLSESHFLILPTRAEAYGLVFAEAAAFGLPSLALQTGGVPTLVRNGHTGILFNPEAGAGQWADQISRLVSDPDRYLQMAMSAHEHYCSRLNWQAAAQRLHKIITTTLAPDFLSNGQRVRVKAGEQIKEQAD